MLMVVQVHAVDVAAHVQAALTGSVSYERFGALKLNEAETCDLYVIAERILLAKRRKDWCYVDKAVAQTFIGKCKSIAKLRKLTLLWHRAFPVRELS